MSISRIALGLYCTIAAAGPLEFGKAELNRALESRGMSVTTLRLITEVTTDAPETFQIQKGRIFGGDLRGLMYGLFEAAAQIRRAGKLSAAQQAPAIPVRGVRVVDPKIEGWHAYMQLLALSRINLVSAHYRELPALETTCTLSQAAAEHAVDFELSLEATPAGLDQVLLLCRSIKAIRAPGGPELMAAVQHAGRRLEVNRPLLRISSGPWVSSQVVARLWAPGGFLVDAPHRGERFHQIWGSVAYDRAAAASCASCETEERAAELFALIHPPGNAHWFATPGDAVSGGTSARVTPVQRASLINQAAFQLQKTSDRAIASLVALARHEARKLTAEQQLAEYLRTGYQPALEAARRNLQSARQQLASTDVPASTLTALEEAIDSARAGNQPLAPMHNFARPRIQHTPSGPAVTLRISPHQYAAAVRLHRVNGEVEERRVMGPVVTFAAPASPYYFEVLPAFGQGWYEPDPLTSIPFYMPPPAKK